MDNSAAAAYDRIDKTVTKNLQAAREILQKLRENVKSEPRSKKTSSSKSASKSSSSKKKKKKAEKKVGPISDNGNLTPNTRRKRIEMPVKKERPVGYTESLEPLINLASLQKSREGDCTPDTLFPKATYKPMPKRCVDLCHQRLSSSDSSSVIGTFARNSESSDACSTNSSSNTSIPQSDSDIDKMLLSKSSKKPVKTKSDDMFPAATFIPSNSGNRIIAFSSEDASRKTTSSTSGQSLDSISMSQLPMTFYSTDGKMKMLLARSGGNEHVAGFLGKVKADKEDDYFPIVPRQLASSSKIHSPCRNKFNALVKIGNTALDISGIFQQKRLNVSNLDKLVINGKTYSSA